MDNVIGMPNLTRIAGAAILLTVATHLASGILNLFNIGAKTPTPQFGVFLCPLFRAAACRALSVMAGCGGPRSRGPAPMSGVENPLHPVAQIFSTIGGGYIPCEIGITK